MKTNYSMIICFRIILSNSVDSKKLTFRDKNNISSQATIKAVILKSEALKISMPFCKCSLSFIKSNTFKPVTLYEGHQYKRNQQKL